MLFFKFDSDRQKFKPFIYIFGKKIECNECKAIFKKTKVYIFGGSLMLFVIFVSPVYQS